ncbi:MAG: cadmium-translocating P-type ATPase [Bacilli bacterium]|jgi:Cd2+/Zn2+-exporting ATPase|nr:cadmium-translocating P-type ATPase [Bacilli bacterium]MCH4278175.1 cadmium-translocating P-type ATPase [Bacilli bacterium]
METTKEKEEPVCSCVEDDDDEPLTKKGLIITIVRLVLTLSLSLLGYFLFTEEKYGVYVNFAFYAAAWLISSYDLVMEAFTNTFIKHKPFDENLLMIIGSLGAFSLIFFGHNEFIEGVMVVFLFQVGELFEKLANERSHKAVMEAVGLRAKTANKLVGDNIVEVDPKDLVIGDHILIKVGDIVPSDGHIEKGSGSLDMSSLTGESMPVEKKEGDYVNSGTILKSGSIVMKVDKAYEDTTVSKILELVENSSKSKSKADKFIDKFALIYTPIVVVLAIIVAVVPPLFIGINNPDVWYRYLYSAICFLVISCPCAIVISVPLTFFSGIGLASKNGIIIKGAAYFDKLNEIGLLVSDKTGTLTYGDFAISEIVPNSIDKDEFLDYLRASESGSNHPLAKAVMKGSDNSYGNDISDYTELSGKGEKLTYKGHKLISGRKEFLEENGINVPSVDKLGSLIYLGVDGVYAGYAVLNDQVRKESREMVEGLKKLGVKTMMLTGDKERSAKEVSSYLGIDECHYELLPEMKTSLLKEKINSTDKAVAYIGDGINDAPSIILADVGVAMGGAGSEMAIDSADIVIMNDDPSKLVTAIKIAKATRSRAITDIVVALIFKVAVMLCSLLIPEFPLFIAVLADTGLTMILVVYSLLLLLKKIK